MSKKIALFTPVFNNEEKLGDALSQIPDCLNGYKTEIVVSDDGSTDASRSIAEQFTDHIVTLEKNSGVGAATKAGLEYISNHGEYDYVIKFDADGQHNLSFLGLVVTLLQFNDLVICSRFHPLSDQTYTPVDRILLNMIFVEMIRKITDWKLTDVRSGFMGLHFSDVQAFASGMIVPGYGVPMEIILRLWHLKPDASVVDVPHPAMYSPKISNGLKRKYSTEVLTQKASRLQIAYEALLMIVEDLGVSREQILEMNGFAT